jgi:deoxyribodipyrimidine photo-lyase
MRTAVVLLTRDLRVHDNASLAAACREADRVVPLFVIDEAILGAGFAVPNRAEFLAASLADLDASLRRRGSWLVVRRGDVVRETMRVADQAGADVVHLLRDASRHAVRRQEALARACAAARRELRLSPGVTAVPLGELTPRTGDHYRVYSPFWRAWSRHLDRPAAPAPERIVPAEEVVPGNVPAGADIAPGARAPGLAPGGETAGRAQLAAWVAGELAGYPEHHDDLPGDRTSRLAPYIHFGCVSAADGVPAARSSPGSCAGATSTRRCWRPSRNCPGVTTATAARGGAATRSASARGPRAAPACRSSTPACARCGARASCTTAPGSSRRRTS